MDCITKLLHDRNKLLIRFYHLNDEEILRLQHDDFSNLEYFYQNRESLLGYIQQADKNIEDVNKNVVSLKKLTDSEKDDVNDELDFKSELVSKIIEQDVHILSLIEEEKNKIFKDLKQATVAEKALSKYKVKGY